MKKTEILVFFSAREWFSVCHDRISNTMHQHAFLYSHRWKADEICGQNFVLIVFFYYLYKNHIQVWISKSNAFLYFLEAPSHLYKRVCQSVRPSVRPSGRRSVTPSLRRVLGASYAVCSALFIKLAVILFLHGKSRVKTQKGSHQWVWARA